MVLGTIFFTSNLDFYFPFSIWNFIFLFYLNFYFPFLFGLLFNRGHILDFFQIFHLQEWKRCPSFSFIWTFMLIRGQSRSLHTLCIFACAKLNVIKKMCEMFQWKKDLWILTTDIIQECSLFSVKRCNWRSHYCRKNVAEKKRGFFELHNMLEAPT